MNRFKIISISILFITSIIVCDDKNPTDNNEEQIIDKGASVTTDKLIYSAGDTVHVYFNTGNINDTLYTHHCNFEHYGINIKMRQDTTWVNSYGKICLAYYQSGIMPLIKDSTYTDEVVLPPGTYQVHYKYDTTKVYPTMTALSPIFEVQ